MELWGGRVVGGGAETGQDRVTKGPQCVPSGAGVVPSLPVSQELYFSMESFFLLDLNLNYHDHL